LYLNKAEIAKYVKENPRTTHASFTKPESQNLQIAEETTSKGLRTFESQEQFEAMLKTVSPHIKEFVESHQKDRERLRELEDKKGIIEKNAAIWKTSLFWLVGVSMVAGGLWWSSHKELSNKLNELSKEISAQEQELSSKDNELSQTKTSLIEKDTELKTIKDLYKVQNMEVNAGGTNDNRSK
jgi:chromosome segregation ATPase